ncbi:MAG: response regulator [Bdellovibrio sp.]|nr:response regulator [Bdellovibrio sp.]
MALRVLLADESSTIKKAILMALAEFGVDVKSVPSGLDVLSVAHTFEPDIVLADVLLSKKNGYQVCNELKADPITRNIPVILMWSSFMQIDLNQAEKVKSDGTLEKPFDTEGLKALIEKFVPKTNKFPLKGLLNHPPLPDFEESGTFVRQKSEFNAKSVPVTEESTTRALIDDDEVDDFSLNSIIPQTPKKQSAPPTDSGADEWSSSSAGQFVIETESFGEYEEVTVVNTKSNQPSTPDLQRRIQQQVTNYLDETSVIKNKSQISQPEGLAPKQMTAFDEQILREEIKQMAERICWQIIPEITEKVVREEMHKLLQGIEKNF